MKSKLSIILFSIFATVCFTACGGDDAVAELPDIPVVPVDPTPAPDTPSNPDEMLLDAKQIVADIRVGWNLGNTCESGAYDGYAGSDLDIETCWGNPKTTKSMMTALKNAGFNAIRIPVRWCAHADADMNINDAWMRRVKEVVDYAYKQDMYVILNSHHDNWYDRLPRNYNDKIIKSKFETMWRQIATAFRDYGDHLIFAGVNEVITKDGNAEYWNNPQGNEESLLAEMMQLFVNTVRATGGNNAVRSLMIQCYAGNADFGCKVGFRMPNDNIADRLIFEFHYYTWQYSTEASDANKYFWGEPYKSYTPWRSNGETEVQNLMKKVKAKFIDKGVPAIMAEFGCVQHNNSSNEAKCDENRAYYHQYVVSEAKKNGIAAFYWDNGSFNGNGENFGLLDRKTCTFPARAKKALDGIMRGLDASAQ